MNFRGIVELIGLLVSKIFLRAVVLLGLLIFLSSIFPWTKGLYDEIFPQPELRISQFIPVQDGRLGTEWWYQRIAVVENRGNSTAKEIYISVSVPSGRISRYNIFADYPYLVHQSSSTSQGYLMLTTGELAPGARVIVYLWGSQNIDSQSAEISFAAVHASGSALRSTERSSTEQIQDIVDQAIASFKLTGDFIVNNEKIRNLRGVNNQGIYFIIPPIPSYVAIVAFTIAFLAWVFLEPVKTAIIYGVIVVGIYWLTVENIYLLPSYLIIASLSVMVFLLIASRSSRQRISRVVRREGNSSMEQSSSVIEINDQVKWMYVLSITVAVIGIVFLFIPFPIAYQATGYISIWYGATIISLAVL